MNSYLLMETAEEKPTRKNKHSHHPHDTHENHRSRIILIWFRIFANAYSSFETKIEADKVCITKSIVHKRICSYTL